MIGAGDCCIRDSEGRICAWLVGMSDEDIKNFLDKYPGTYLSVAEETEEGIR
jgi:hypothetical protein